ncbi:MAG: RNase adapter RapZ [Thermoanaerobaculia bacterium]
MQEHLKALFEKRFGELPVDVTMLAGDGSARKIYRVQGRSRTVAGVYGPDRRENIAFLGFSKHFRAEGLRVPEIFAEDLDTGYYLLEDLGDTTLFDHLVAGRTESGPSPATIVQYEKVVEALPKFQFGAGRTLDYSICYPRAAFDKQSMMWDLNYFKYYFLKLAGIPFSEDRLEADYERMADYLDALPRDAFLYRDFQSRNIMVRDDEPWFIDYQGGRRGAPQYDIASLLLDPKADLPFDLRDHLLERYLDAAGNDVDRESFLAAYPLFAYIRLMQAMGAFGLRGFFERKTHFLQSIPYAVHNLEHLLLTTELPIALPELTAALKRVVGAAKLRTFGHASLKLTVRIQSFSYTGGMPTDDKGHGGGFVFDCRSLPNPGRHIRYKNSWGTDDDVIEFLEREPSVGRFLEHVCALVDDTVAEYKRRNFTDLLVAFGCTGGQHRSVYCASRLAEHLKKTFPDVDLQVTYREKEAKR